MTINGYLHINVRAVLIDTKPGSKTRGFSAMFSLRINVPLFCAFLAAEKNQVCDRWKFELGFFFSIGKKTTGFELGMGPIFGPVAMGGKSLVCSFKITLSNKQI